MRASNEKQECAGVPVISMDISLTSSKTVCNTLYQKKSPRNRDASSKASYPVKHCHYMMKYACFLQEVEHARMD